MKERYGWLGIGSDQYAYALTGERVDAIIQPGEWARIATRPMIPFKGERLCVGTIPAF